MFRLFQRYLQLVQYLLDYWILGPQGLRAGSQYRKGRAQPRILLKRCPNYTVSGNWRKMTSHGTRSWFRWCRLSQQNFCQIYEHLKWIKNLEILVILNKNEKKVFNSIYCIQTTTYICDERIFDDLKHAFHVKRIMFEKTVGRQKFVHYISMENVLWVHWGFVKCTYTWVIECVKNMFFFH